jgi:PAS domain S-box-containing protein
VRTRVAQLFAIQELNGILEALYRLTGLSTTLLDADGRVVASVGWQDICVRFHRSAPETARECCLVDPSLLSRLPDRSSAGLTCRNGLLEYATPILVRGRHLATLLVGQFLHEPPDEERFRRQARDAGFDEASYLEALRRVPIVPEERFRSILEAQLQIGRVLGALGLERVYLQETRAHLRQSEARFRAIANYSRNWEDWIGPEGKLLWVNTAVERITGYAAGECVSMAEYPLPMVQDEDRTVVRRHIQNALDGQAPIEEVEFRIRRKDGETIWGLGGWQPIYDETGARVGCRGSIQDITPRKRVEREVLARTRQLEAVYRTARELVEQLDLHLALRLICLRAAKIVRADGCGIFLWDEAEHALVPHTGFEPPQRGARRGSVKLGEGLEGRVAARRQGLAVDDYARWADAPRSPLKRMRIGACWAEPLLHRNRLTGVIVLWSRACGPQFSTQDAKPLKLFAAQAAIAIENARLYASVTAHLDEVRGLSSRLMAVREEEATRIARDLHDEVGQSLTSILLGLQALRSAGDLEAVWRQADELRSLAEKSLGEIRRVIRSVRPPSLDEGGLVLALARHLREYAAATGLRIDFCAPGLDDVPLPADVSITLFRIAQEAVTNVAKHAQAQCASVTLTHREGRLVLLVEDDGRGFDVGATRRSPRKTDHLGLVGMEERAALLGGSVRVESTPGRGTTVIAEMSLESGRAEHGTDSRAGG